MEVVLPNGEVLRTGMGALPASKSWQEYRHGYGPDPCGPVRPGQLRHRHEDGLPADAGSPSIGATGSITVPKREDLIPLDRDRQLPGAICR